MSNEQAEEVWLPIAGFEGFYRISNLGRVESMCRGRPRILKPFRDNYGYELIGLLSGTVKRPSSKVHSLVAEAFLGKRPPGFQVNHKNGVKTDNRLENLEYVTPQQNVAHAIAAGLINCRGENGSAAKLNESQVIEIRRLRANGESSESVAKKFNVASAHVRRITRRKCWGHI